jgi:hypothetical protein
MSGEGDLKLHSNSEEMLLGSKRSCWKSLRTTLKFSIFTNPLFLVVGITNLIACLGLFVPYFYLPNMVEEKNFTKEESSFLISAMGKDKIFIWDCFYLWITLFSIPFVICGSVPENG